MEELERLKLQLENLEKEKKEVLKDLKQWYRSQLRNIGRVYFPLLKSLIWRLDDPVRLKPVDTGLYDKKLLFCRVAQ